MKRYITQSLVTTYISISNMRNKKTRSIINRSIRSAMRSRIHSRIIIIRQITTRAIYNWEFENGYRTVNPGTKNVLLACP